MALAFVCVLLPGSFRLSNIPAYSYEKFIEAANRKRDQLEKKQAAGLRLLSERYERFIIQDTSIYCRERPGNKADGAQKPECIPTCREGFQAPPNAVIESRNKKMEVPFIRLKNNMLCRWFP